MCKLLKRILDRNIAEEEEIDDNGTLIDGHCLDSPSGDAERGSDTISECGGATISIELFQSPVQSYRGSDLVERLNFNFAASSEIKLKIVLNADESPLSTAFVLGECTRATDTGIPSCFRLKLATSVDLISASVRIIQAKCQPSDIGTKRVSHLVGWSTCHLDHVVVISLNLDWESGQTHLTCVETIPHVVHETVYGVLITCLLARQRDRLH